MQKGQYETSVPTWSDKLVGEVVAAYLEKRVEPVFHPDSYGYRPRKSDANRRRQYGLTQFTFLGELTTTGPMPPPGHIAFDASSARTPVVERADLLGPAGCGARRDRLSDMRRRRARRDCPHRCRIAGSPFV
jgi:hypothetical protein